jgi:hypothetical protein
LQALHSFQIGDDALYIPVNNPKQRSSLLDEWSSHLTPPLSGVENVWECRREKGLVVINGVDRDVQ